MTEQERNEAVARAVLAVTWGETNAQTIWSIWTSEQRAEAANAVAFVVPILERAIEGMAA